MKKILNYVLAMYVAVLFSSCGSLSITQMRYTKGLNVNLFADKGSAPVEHKAQRATKKKQNNETNLVKNNELKENVSMTDVQSDDVVATTPTKQTQLASNTKLENKISKILKAQNISIQKSNIENTKSGVKTIKKQLRQALKNSPNKSNDSDVALLLLVIIALIIPPLAVFLYYGELNTHFWINLILCLIAGGVIASGSLVGFGLPVLHALLVVFGVFG